MLINTRRRAFFVAALNKVWKADSMLLKHEDGREILATRTMWTPDRIKYDNEYIGVAWNERRKAKFLAGEFDIKELLKYPHNDETVFEIWKTPESPLEYVAKSIAYLTQYPGNKITAESLGLSRVLEKIKEKGGPPMPM